ncbi:hypothetical protein LXL04_018849 [Taraxacum kok-saghyz]
MSIFLIPSTEVSKARGRGLEESSIPPTSSAIAGINTKYFQLIKKSNIIKNQQNFSTHCELSYHCNPFGKMMYHRKITILEFIQNAINKELLHLNLRSWTPIVVKDDLKKVTSIKPDKIHEPRLLDENESLKVFCLYAFGQNHPNEGYEEVSRKAQLPMK